MNLKEKIELELKTTALQIFINNQNHLDIILNKLVKLNVVENAKQFKKYTINRYNIKSLVLRKFSSEAPPRVYSSSKEEPNDAYKLIKE